MTARSRSTSWGGGRGKRALLALTLSTAVTGATLAPLASGSTLSAAPAAPVAPVSAPASAASLPDWDAPVALAAYSRDEDNVSSTRRLSVNAATSANRMRETGRGVLVAVLDSGVNEVPGLQGRVYQGPDFTGEGRGDDYGHGTFVAGLIAGDGSDYRGNNTGIKGLAPEARILSVKVADSQGRSTVGQVAAGLAWVVKYADRLGIDVVNLSLSMQDESSYLSGPLNALVEAAWFKGVVVVASAGNNGQVTHAPGNDPFIITAGSTYDRNTATRRDDTHSPYSGMGRTLDGFAKADVNAPGQHVQSTVPPRSVLAGRMTTRGLPYGYGQLSGTSMSAAVVSGATALLLDRYPGLAPDKVKGMMLQLRNSSLNMYDLLRNTDAPLANQNLKPSVALASAYADLIVNKPYDQVDWNNVDWASVAWQNATWTNATWTSATWTNATWTSNGWTASAEANAVWTNATWTSATWTSATWTSATWTSATWSN